MWTLLLSTALATNVDEIENLFGATHMAAMAGNGGLSVGFAPTGEVTVLRWPSPSYFDQLNYRTSDDVDAREQPFFGALENEGLFAGLWTPDHGLTWLRGLEQSQAYAGPGSPVVEQALVDGDWDVLQRATVHPDLDLLVLSWDLVALPQDAELVLFENLAPCLTKTEKLPITDWYDDGLNDFGAVYLADHDALVHFTVADADDAFDWGADAHDDSAVAADFPGVAAGLGQGIYVAIGLGPDSTGHQVGLDATESCGRDFAHQPQDAFDDASDGVLSGSAVAACQVTGALQVGVMAGDTVDAYVAIGNTLDEALALLATGRDLGATAVRQAAEDAAQSWLSGADLPAVSGQQQAFAERTLLALHQGTDRETGAVVASISTQPPYGEDWPRDSAFFNAALDLAGKHDAVTRHNLFLAELQAQEEDNGTPAGAWYMNYYADGMIGGFIPFEIDEVGFSLWTLWAHAPFLADDTERGDYLAAVWPAIALGADLLTECVDDATGLQCYANEDDNQEQTQTIHGAATVLLGLRSAIEASEAVCGDSEQRGRWQDREAALLAAIETLLWDDVRGSFVAVEQDRPWPAPTIDAGWWLWPVRGWAHDDPRNQSHAEVIFEWARAALDGETEGGGYLNKATLGLAWAWQDRPQDLARNQRLIDLMAEDVPTSTNHVGEVFVTGDFDGDGDWEYDNRTAVPHLWAATLTFLSQVVQHEPERLAPFDADGRELAQCFEGDPGGCGCSAQPGAGPGWMAAWLVTLGVVGRRRQPLLCGG